MLPPAVCSPVLLTQCYDLTLFIFYYASQFSGVCESHRDLVKNGESESLGLGYSLRLCISILLQVMLILLVYEPHFE